MPFKCCQMGLLRMLTQLVQLLQDQRDEVQKQTQHAEEQTSILKDILEKQDQQAYAISNLHHQLGAIELRTSKTMSSPGDALRHVGQEGFGEIWGANDQCYLVVAQLMRQQGVFSKGHLPVLADKNRGQFFAAQGVLQQHRLLSDNENWQDGNVACALPGIHTKLIQASQKMDPQNPLTHQEIDQILGITPAIRTQLDQAVRNAFPRHHGGTQGPVNPTDQEYITQLYEMVPRHAIGVIFPGRFHRP